MTVMIIMMIIIIIQSNYNEIKAKSYKIPKVEKKQRNLAYYSLLRETSKKKTFSPFNGNYEDFNIISGNYEDFHDNSFIIDNNDNYDENDNDNDNNNDKIIITMIILIVTAIIAIINSILIIFILKMAIEIITSLSLSL